MLTLVALSLALVGVALPARADQAAPAPIVPIAQAFSLQGGWWSVEVEVKSRWGVYFALGVPWVAAPLTLLSGATWVVPVESRVGYDLALTPRWSLRGAVHGALSVSNENAKCGCQNPGVETRVFGFAELGVRHEFPGGFVFGVDVPVFAINFPRKGFPPPASLAFSQAYVGYSWRR